MSAAQHTAGSWAYADAAWDATNTAYTVYGAANLLQPVADVLKTANAHANARLIAAAPDLLEACQTLAEWLAREEDFAIDFAERVELCSLAQKQVLAAIAKATGSPT